MERAVMISIRPKWCELIALGYKTMELRKTAPKSLTPFKCYIYETHDRKHENIGVCDPKALLYNNFIHYPGKVIGEFVCDALSEVTLDRAGIPTLHYSGNAKDWRACVTAEECRKYLGNRKRGGLGWHISDLKIYDTPREISEFKRWNRTEDNSPCAHVKALYEPCETCTECNLKRAPQSWCYVEEV